MGASNNPFSDLLGLKRSSNLDEANKQRRKGERERNRLLPKYGIPPEALAMRPDTGTPPTPLNQLPQLLNEPQQQQTPASAPTDNPFADLIGKKKENGTIKSLKDFASQISKSLPSGINMATGMMSMAFPGEQADLVANLPQAARGTQPTTSEWLEQEAGKMIPGLEVGGAPVMSFGKGVKSLMATKNLNPKELAYGVQKGHDTLFKQSSDLYDLVKNEAPLRGVGNIELSEKLLSEADKHLPNTEASKMLLEKAKKGNYQALHELQSDLGKRGTKALSAATHADRNVGEEMLDTRSKINKAIRDKFKEYGHEDLANILDEAKNKYRQLKDTYYSHPTISKLVHPDIRKVPKNPLSVFSEESKSMGKVLSAHPEISQALSHHENAANFMKKIGKISNIGLKGLGLGTIGAGSYLGTKKLIDLLSGS